MTKSRLEWYYEMEDCMSMNNKSKDIEYFKNNLSKYPKKVYLSLGNTEKNGRNMSKCVQDKTEELLYYLKNKGIDVIFELNEGGHFKNVYLRIAKGIKWIL